MHERSESSATVHRAIYAAVCRSLSLRCSKMFLDFSKPLPERSVHHRPGPFPSEGEEPVAMQEKQRDDVSKQFVSDASAECSQGHPVINVEVFFFFLKRL